MIQDWSLILVFSFPLLGKRFRCLKYVHNNHYLLLPSCREMEYGSADPRNNGCKREGKVPEASFPAGDLRGNAFEEILFVH